MNVIWLGSDQPYQEVHSRMKDLLQKRVANEIDDHLLLVEHQPTFTLGRRRESKANIFDPQGVPVVAIERGGDVTFHGPGQLTGYPIVKLPKHRQDLHAYLHFLEDFWIETLLNKGIPAEKDDRNTGVWADGRKLVAIGIACRRWVAWHGFACNVSVDLQYYQRIHPCGMPSNLVGNIEDYRREESMPEFADNIGQRFSQKWMDWTTD